MAAATTNPLEPEAGLARVSKRTVYMAGLLVDVYGLDELRPSVTYVSCLWLHHPRKGSKEGMATFASRAVAAWNEQQSSSAAGASSRGLIALAFDQRNHGSRLARALANEAWRDGNATHAQDMFGTISGTVVDQAVLLDAVDGYLFHDDVQTEELTGPKKRTIDQHLALGVSLGGHSVWQLLFADPRVTAGAAIIGCPDFMNLLYDRARLSKLGTYTADQGASFFGSKDFPPALVAACEKFDPKGIIFGAGAVVPTDADQEEYKVALRERVGGKRFLLCSGSDDKAVPYRCSQPFTDWFKQAATADGTIYVENNIYPGIGHKFSADMVKDAVRFVLDTVGSHGAQQERARASFGEERSSKI